MGDPDFGLANKGQRMFGASPITNKDHVDDEVRLMIGFRNSYDRTMSVGICFGSKVFVCDNMAFSGYTTDGEEAFGEIHHRHQCDVMNELRSCLKEALDKFSVFRSYQESLYNRLKEIGLTDADAHDLIIRAARAEAITPKDCFHVANE